MIRHIQELNLKDLVSKFEAVAGEEKDLEELRELAEEFLEELPFLELCVLAENHFFLNESIEGGEDMNPEGMMRTHLVNHLIDPQGE